MPPLGSIIAILCLVFSFSGIMGLQVEEPVPFRGGELASGGIIGHYVSGYMRDFLNYFGSYVFLLAIFIVALMVSTHISFGWIFSKITLWISGIARGLKEYYAKRAERRRKKRVREKSIG